MCLFWIVSFPLCMCDWLCGWLIVCICTYAYVFYTKSQINLVIRTIERSNDTIETYSWWKTTISSFSKQFYLFSIRFSHCVAYSMLSKEVFIGEMCHVHDFFHIQILRFPSITQKLEWSQFFSSCKIVIFESQKKKKENTENKAKQKTYE